MIFITRSFLLLACLGCLAWQSCAHTSPIPPQTSDAGPSGNSCSTACARGAALGCLYATPTPAGAPCETVCANAAATVPWDVAGLSAAAACSP
jgi:hypothetical protein